MQARLPSSLALDVNRRSSRSTCCSVAFDTSRCDVDGARFDIEQSGDGGNDEEAAHVHLRQHGRGLQDERNKVSTQFVSQKA